MVFEYKLACRLETHKNTPPHAHNHPERRKSHPDARCWRAHARHETALPKAPVPRPAAAHRPPSCLPPVPWRTRPCGSPGSTSEDVKDRSAAANRCRPPRGGRRLELPLAAAAAAGGRAHVCICERGVRDVFPLSAGWSGWVAVSRQVAERRGEAVPASCDRQQRRARGAINASSEAHIAPDVDP